LGAELRRKGVATLIFDRQAAGENTSRAAVVHARTLEVLEPLQLSEEMIKHGLKVEIFRIRDRDKQVLEIDFKDIPSNYSFSLMIPQNETEALLLERLKALGGDVVRPCEVTSIRQERDSVTVTANHEGTTKEFRAKYAVGCDGAHSIVREQVGIDFEGGAYEQSFVLGDVAMDWPFGRQEVTLFFSSGGLVVVAPLPHDRYRIAASFENAPEQPSASDLQKVLDERGPTTNPAKIQSVAWSSRFRIQHRVAKTMKKGRVMVAGDAAHVHSPAGGQGMNTGIQDAIALAEALGPVLRRTDPPLALDEWAKSRQEIARRVVALTDRMTRMATAQSHAMQTLRNSALAFAGHIPLFREAVAENLAELHNR
jgi:2-polyprenyl-6-methoxyphenol hydroxylase-like FAD-dependent oxidoreductase